MDIGIGFHYLQSVAWLDRELQWLGLVSLSFTVARHEWLEMGSAGGWVGMFQRLRQHLIADRHLLVP